MITYFISVAFSLFLCWLLLLKIFKFTKQGRYRVEHGRSMVDDLLPDRRANGARAQCIPDMV